MSRIFKWLVFSFSHYLIFEGEYLKGKKWNGKGYNDKNEVEYEIKDGNSIITEKGYHFLKFKGQYINGRENGEGKEYYINGQLEFEGEYLNGLKNGNGKQYYENGKLKFEGEYLYGNKIRGKFYVNEKLEYDGEYLNEER